MNPIFILPISAGILLLCGAWLYATRLHRQRLERRRLTPHQAETRIATLEKLLRTIERRADQDAAYIRQLDGILEEVGGVSVSCINPYEDLKMAVVSLKKRAENAEERLERLKGILSNQMLTDEEIVVSFKSEL